MIRVGKIINTRGLKGDCKIMLTTDEADDRFSKGRVLYLKDGRPLEVLSFSMYKGFGYARFAGVDSVEKAEALKNQDLFIRQEDLPLPEEDEFYYHQLMDCEVFNEKDEPLGTVSDILETGANLVLRVSKDGKSWLLPFVEAFVLDVNPEQKKMVIREMEGLR